MDFDTLIKEVDAAVRTQPTNVLFVARAAALRAAVKGGEAWRKTPETDKQWVLEIIDTRKPEAPDVDSIDDSTLRDSELIRYTERSDHWRRIREYLFPELNK